MRGRAAAPDGAIPAGRSLPPATLDVWLWWKDPVEPLQQMGERFAQKVPGSKVNVDAPAAYWDKLTSALAGSAGPDLFFMNNVNYWAWANRGLLVDLDRLVAADGEMRRNLDASWKDAVTFYKFQGKNYGLPYLYTTVVLYYNTELLKAANLKPPAEVGDAFDWTMARDYAQQLTRREGGDVRTWGIMSTEGIETGWLNFVRANGGDFLDKDHQKCVVDQPAAQEAWQYLVDLRVKDRLSPDVPALQAMSAQNLFINGKLALWPNGSWQMKTLNALRSGLQYDVALLPAAPKTRRRGGTTNIVGVVLNKDGKSRDQSWALLTHLLSKEFTGHHRPRGRPRPGAQRFRRSLLRSDARPGQPQGGPWHAALDDAPPGARAGLLDQMLVPVNEWQPKILEGSVPVKDGLTQMAAQVNALLGVPR